MTRRQLVSLFLAAVMLLSLSAAGAAEGYVYDNRYGSNMVQYMGSYDMAAYPPAEATAAFLNGSIAVDGVIDEAWAAADAVAIERVQAIQPNESALGGTMKLLWNGPLLYLLVDVDDATPQRGDDPKAYAGDRQEDLVIPEDRDSVTVAIDLYGDRTVYEANTRGVITVTASGEVAYHINTNIDSFSSIFSSYSPDMASGRLAGWAAADKVDENGKVTGYTVEVAFHIEGLGEGRSNPANGKEFAIDVELNDAAPVTLTAEDGTQTQAVQRVNKAFWSHDPQNAAAGYADLVTKGQNMISVDWGHVVLDGCEDANQHAYSQWRIEDALRYMDTLSFPKGTYTADTQAALDAAVAAAKDYLNKGVQDKAEADRLASGLEGAIHGLQWAAVSKLTGEPYPDPQQLPDVMTLPDPYQFFQRDRRVRNAADWAERSAEILDLAQYYEYGYKPEAPEAQAIKSIKHYSVGDEKTLFGMYFTGEGGWNGWHFGEYKAAATYPEDEVTVAITDGGVTVDLVFNICYPTDEQLAAAGYTRSSMPIVLCMGGSDVAAFRDHGIATVLVPEVAGGDMRSSAYVWDSPRSGIFYTLYPYARNGEAALKEVSTEMANAWGATRVLDALALLAHAEGDLQAAAAEILQQINIEHVGVTGFSIYGKYAFVAGAFDDRIDLTMPGASGATGLSPWRYVYWGQEHTWSGTPFDSGDPAFATTVAFGTETIVNSVNHNRVRQTEVFRQFLNPGYHYKQLKGAYGFATRLPFDQSSIIATFATKGRAVMVINTPNDYNDGCVSDALGLQAAKAVYRNLGLDADALVTFNYRNVFTMGDPHGTDAAQYARAAEYMHWLFHGTPMGAETAERLATDPFALNVANGGTQSVYDYYYGGFDTITGGDGENPGWYAYSFE